MKTISLLSMLIVGSAVFSQEERAGFSLANFSTSIGFTMSRTNDLSIEQLNQIAPNSILIDKYQYLLGKRIGRSTTYANGLNEAQLNISFRHNKRKNHRLQFGLTYQHRNIMGRNDGVNQRYTVDSLESQQSGTTYAVDSFATKGIISAYYSKVLNLMGSYRIHKNINNHWSFFGGVGLTVGLTFNNTTRISHYESGGTVVSAFNQSPTQGAIPIDYSYHEHEEISNDPGFSLGAFLPVGIEYTFGDWESKINSLSLFVEVQPGYFSQYIPELSTFSSAFYSTQTFGIRVGL